MLKYLKEHSDNTIKLLVIIVVTITLGITFKATTAANYKALLDKENPYKQTSGMSQIDSASLIEPLRWFHIW